VKRFFFEKKKQKTSFNLGHGRWRGRSPTRNAAWVSALTETGKSQTLAIEPMQIPGEIV
jgi:hypothetical protein